jgi:hypothetical protein
MLCEVGDGRSGSGLATMLYIVGTLVQLDSNGLLSATCRTEPPGLRLAIGAVVKKIRAMTLVSVPRHSGMPRIGMELLGVSSCVSLSCSNCPKRHKLLLIFFKRSVIVRLGASRRCLRTSSEGARVIKHR